jgi:hypothetical protein
LGEHLVAAISDLKGAQAMGFKHYAATAGALAMLVVMAGAVPAQATVFESGRFAFEESVEEDLCGIAVRRDRVASGHFRDRTGKGDLDQAFFAQASYRFTDTYTNLATGASFSEEGRLTSMDVKATPLGGNIFEFRFRESGMVVIRDMAGDVVSRGRGAIWWTQVFDTLGDSMPGGEDLAETVDRISGPHPLFEEEAYCATVHDLIG